jgi:hypothetical protein
MWAYRYNRIDAGDAGGGSVMGAVAEVQEKRISPRVRVQGHLRYRRIPISDRGPRNAIIQDVSLGGFRFRSDELLNRKSSVLLELHLPNSHSIRSLATVAWVKAMPEDGGYEIGGMFVEPTHATRAALEKIVSEH